MTERTRKHPVQFYLSDDEQYILDEKFRLSKMRSKSAFLRKLVLYGFVYDVDYSHIREMNALLGNISGNLNQIAKRVNTTNTIYKKAIGLAHAGWRGTVGRIGEKVVQKMTELYGTNPSDLKCAIGPAISVCCYEVDKPCADHFLALKNVNPSDFVHPKENGKYMVDLLETNRQILVAAGVKPENITISDVCTNCNSDLLWSHRATKGHRGTMCAFMCLK